MSILWILVIGDSQVGKTALIVRFLTRRYIGEYCSLTDAVYHCVVDVEGIPTQLEILDTFGKPGRNADIDEGHIRWANACIVVYSIVSATSFQKAESMIKLIRGIKPSLPTLLLRNKVDIDPGREVSVQEGRQLAHALSCTYQEVSAAEDIVGTLEAFYNVIKNGQQFLMKKMSNAKRRKNSLGAVSKRLSAMFGKKDTNTSFPGDLARNSVQAMEVVKL